MMEIAATGFVLLCILALVHFAYESIILPTIRMRFRNRLFALRDELRELRFAHEKPKISDEVYQTYEKSLNFYLNHLHAITIHTQVTIAMRLGNDREFRKAVDEKQELFDGCECEEFQYLRLRSARLMLSVIAANNLIAILPILIAYGLASDVKRRIKLLSSFISTPTAGMMDVYDKESAFANA